MEFTPSKGRCVDLEKYGSRVCHAASTPLEGLREYLKCEDLKDCGKHVQSTFFLEGVSYRSANELATRCNLPLFLEGPREIELEILKALGAKSLAEAREKILEVSSDFETVEHIVNKLFVVPQGNITESIDKYCHNFGLNLSSKFCELALMVEFFYFQAIVRFIECRSNGNALPECEYLLPNSLRVRELLTVRLSDLDCLEKIATKPDVSEETRRVARAILSLIEREYGIVLP